VLLVAVRSNLRVQGAKRAVVGAGGRYLLGEGILYVFCVRAGNGMVSKCKNINSSFLRGRRLDRFLVGEVDKTYDSLKFRGGGLCIRW